MSSRIGSRGRRRKGWMAGIVVAALASLWVAVPSASAVEGPITSGGPLTEIDVNHQLGCQLFNNETRQFDTGEVVENYCGTFVGLQDGTIFGDQNATDDPVDAYDFVSQDLTGDGSTANPFKLVTVVEVPVLDGVDSAGGAETAAAPAQGASLLTLTETETYFTGDDFFRTDLTAHNDTNGTFALTLYHAGDCAIDQVDTGYAVDDTAQSGAVFCEPPQELQEVFTASTVPPIGNAMGILGFVPIGGNSHYLEDLAGEGDGNLFNAIDGSDFPDECNDCDLDPDDEESPVDNGVGLSWALSLPANGSATRCFYTVNSFDNNVPNIPSDCNPASTPPATIAQQPPPQCKLRISRARVFLFRKHPRLRLVARYRSAEPADVLINFIAIEGSDKVNLGDVTRHFKRHGLFRLREELSQDQSDTLWQTHRFVVHFKIPGEPGFCERKYKKELTVPRIVDGQRVVFQSDSKFGSGPGHPEH